MASLNQPGPTRRRCDGRRCRHGGMGTEQVQVTVCVANAFTTVSPEPGSESCYCSHFYFVSKKAFGGAETQAPNNPIVFGLHMAFIEQVNNQLEVLFGVQHRTKG